MSWSQDAFKPDRSKKDSFDTHTHTHIYVRPYERVAGSDTVKAALKRASALCPVIAFASRGVC